MAMGGLSHSDKATAVPIVSRNGRSAGKVNQGGDCATDKSLIYAGNA